MKLTDHGFAPVNLVITFFIVVNFGTAGWLVYNDSSKDSPKATPAAANSEAAESEAPVSCNKGEDVTATNGMFCSAEFGVRLPVPNEFRGLFTVGEPINLEDYDFTKGELITVGSSEKVYEAQFWDPDDSDVTTASDYILTIAKFPRISHYPPSFVQAYYDDDKEAVFSDETSFDAKSRTLGDEVDSIKAGDIKFYETNIGDAGTGVYTYTGVVGDSIIRISLKVTVPIGIEDGKTDRSTIDTDEYAKDFAKLIKQLKLVN